MCLAIPAQIVEAGALRARVARGAEQFDVSIHLIAEPLGAGDWVAVHARRDAISKLTPEEAEAITALLGELDAALNPPGA